MDSSDKQESLYPHQPLFPYHHLELSPHCPQHGRYLLPPTHLHLSPNCPFHRHLLLPHCPLHASNNHTQSTTIFPNFPHLPPNPDVNNLNSQPPAYSKSQSLMMKDRNEEDGDEDEEEVIFVLTDEWKEFFAKSEAKRRLAKKQAKKKGKD